MGQVYNKMKRKISDIADDMNDLIKQLEEVVVAVNLLDADTKTLVKEIFDVIFALRKLKLDLGLHV